MSRIPNFQTNPHQRHVPFSLSMSECSRASPFFGRLVHSFLVASHGQFHTRSNFHRHAKCLWVKTIACVCVCVDPANNIQIYPNVGIMEDHRLFDSPAVPKAVTMTTTTFASWAYPDWGAGWFILNHLDLRTIQITASKFKGPRICPVPRNWQSYALGALEQLVERHHGHEASKESCWM